MILNVYLSIAAIAALMFLDYYLTLVGQRLYKGTSSKHFVNEAYELNPAFREAVYHNRYSIKHFFAVVLVAICIFFVHYSGSLRTYALLQGLLLTLFTILITRHLQNILLFRTLNTHPSVVDGKVIMKLEYTLNVSANNTLGYVLVLGMIFALLPSYFMFGCFLAPLILFLKQKMWAKK